MSSLNLLLLIAAVDDGSVAAKVAKTLATKSHEDGAREGAAREGAAREGAAREDDGREDDGRESADRNRRTRRLARSRRTRRLACSRQTRRLARSSRGSRRQTRAGAWWVVVDSQRRSQ